MVLSSQSVIIILLSALTLVGSLLFTIYKRVPTLWNTLFHWTAINKVATLATRHGTSSKAICKQTPANKLKSGNNNNNSSKSKQVHFAEVVSVSSGNEYSNTNGTTKQKQHESATSGQTLNTHKTPNKKTPTAKHGIVANGKSSSEPLNQIKNETKTHAGEINNNNNNPNHAEQPLGSEPSADELDSSVLLEVFNPTKVGMNAAAATKKKQALRQSKSDASLSRKRHSSESNQSSYSSEQLFKMIAASSLSRDEVEIAVETLLNKLEAGDSDWQKPKSDPLHRLKNQLRDSEMALATEIQNHEQTRARLVELKTQLQGERSSRSVAAEELTTIKKDLLTTSTALERAHNELSKQRTLLEQTRDESSKVISKLKEDNLHLQNLLANSNVHHDELNKLRHEFNENVEQLHRYEAANESLKKRMHELEANLRTRDIQLDRMQVDKQHDNYEACAKISELESDRVALEKALKDHIIRLNEVSEANKLLEKSLNETQLSNRHKDEVIERLNDEKHITEASMKRTLFEMEQELRKLHERLSSKMATNDERFRQELDQFERELTDAGQREQKLKLKMKQLREGLSELFPELRSNMSGQTNSDDWVHHYLIALRQLTATVDELRRSNGNDRQDKELGDHNSLDSPSKRSVRSNLSLSHTNGKSSRVGSPTSNGRSSRGEYQDISYRLVDTIVGISSIS